MTIRAVDIAIDDDDRQVGDILSRRQALALLGAGAGMAAFGVSAAEDKPGGRCLVRPETTEGPYYLDSQLNRADIGHQPDEENVSGGVPLTMVLNVMQVDKGTCKPLPGAIVDIWQCDTQGRYSGVEDKIIGYNTLGKKYLRGYQTTPASGQVRFQTIYPGWYDVRAVHVHVKVRAATASGATYEFTSQLYFDDALTDRIHAAAPYVKKGSRIRNASDMFFKTNGGSQMQLAMRQEGAGYLGSFDIGLDLADAKVGKADRFNLDDLPKRLPGMQRS